MLVSDAVTVCVYQWMKALLLIIQMRNVSCSIGALTANPKPTEDKEVQVPLKTLPLKLMFSFFTVVATCLHYSALILHD